jgi:hypothetical protein
VRGAHKYDTNDAFEEAPEMKLWIVARKQDGLLTDNATQAVSDKDERARGRIAGGSVARQIDKEVFRVVMQPII